MQFSLRRLLGFVTLGCLALAAAIMAGPQSLDVAEVLRGFLTVILVVETAAALYAAMDPWVGYPAKLDADRTLAARPRFVAGPVTLTLSVLNGLLFTAMGYIGITVMIGGGLSFDSGGAKTADLLRGSGLIAATCIGAFGRGTCLVGFVCLMCGAPLGRRWALLFGLCGGSFVSLLVWRLTGDTRGDVMAGFAGLLIVVAVAGLAMWSVARGKIFGRRARRWGARSFLLGLAIGAAGAMHPWVEWLLYSWPPISMILGALIGSSLGAVVGLLAGADAVEVPANDELDDEGSSPFAPLE